MRRIYITELSEEDKKKYELRAESLKQKAIKKKKERELRKLSKASRCRNCKAIYSKAFSRENGHKNYCSRTCKNQYISEAKRLARQKNEKRSRESKRLRQKRRLENKMLAIKDESARPLGFYDSREWRRVRFMVLRKYGFVCMACGAKPLPGIPLHVDHVKPRSKYPELELSIDNLQVLCRDCNLGKSNEFEDDLRPK